MLKNTDWSTINPYEYFKSEIPHEIFSFELQVSEVDLDIFGHVNNANYLRYLERARWAFINKNGYGLNKIQEGKKGPVLLEVNLQFRRELKASEHVLILSQCQTVDNKFMTLKQVIIKEDYKLAAEAKFLIGFFDLQVRKLIQPDQEWLTAVGFKTL